MRTMLSPMHMDQCSCMGLQHSFLPLTSLASSVARVTSPEELEYPLRSYSNSSDRLGDSQECRTHSSV